jgi:hypothetical protein
VHDVVVDYLDGPGIQDDDHVVRQRILSSTGYAIPDTAQYVGVTVNRAERLAHDEGRILQATDGADFYLRRASLQPRRVNVLVGMDGRVAVADAG